MKKILENHSDLFLAFAMLRLTAEFCRIVCEPSWGLGLGCHMAPFHCEILRTTLIIESVCHSVRHPRTWGESAKSTQ